MSLTKEGIDRLGYRIEYASRDAWTVKIGGQVVGFALRMANGGWCAFDTNDVRMSPEHFKRPMMVGKWFWGEIQSGRAALSEPSK